MTATNDSPLRKRIADELAERLRAEISGGVRAPGSRVRQAEVDAQYNVSTTPVREAFAMLEREGLLIGSPHRGMVVFHPTIDDLQELYEMRIPLEAVATEKAVENMTPELLTELELILDLMDRAADDRAAYGELNRRFHSTLYSAAGRPRLERLIDDLRDASAAYMRMYRTLAPSARDTQPDHEAIVSACRDRAPKRAAKAMTVHLSHTVKNISERMSDAAPAEGAGVPVSH
jgi:DNA-binding GntR family transcriptional regulator